MSYVAFISYKHSDVSRPHAEQLEAALKRYAKPLWKPPISIFRDERVFRPGDDLPGGIRKALKESKFLLYLASEEAAQSPWIQDELRIWCEELQRASHLIIVHIGGRMTADPRTRTVVWSETNALPELLEPYIPSIPIWSNLSWAAQAEQRSLENERYRNEINSIVARFRDTTPGQMNDVEVLTHRRNILLRNTGIAAITLSGLAAAYFGVQSQRASRAEKEQRARAEVQRKLAEERARNVQIGEAFRLLDRGNENLRAGNVAEASRQFDDTAARLRRLELDPVMALHYSFAAKRRLPKVSRVTDVEGEVSYMQVSRDGDRIAVVYDYQSPGGGPDIEDIPDWTAAGVFQLSTRTWVLKHTVGSALGRKIYDGLQGIVIGFESPHHLILREDWKSESCRRFSLADGSESPVTRKECLQYVKEEEQSTAKEVPEKLRRELDPDVLFGMKPEDGIDEYSPRLVDQVFVASPDRRTAIVGTYEGRLLLLDLGADLVRLRDKYGPIFAAAYRSDGSRAYFCDKAALYEVDTSTGRGVLESFVPLYVHGTNAFRNEKALSVALSDDGSLVAMVTTRRLMCLIVGENRWVEWKLPKEIERAAALRVDSRGQVVDLVVGDEGTLFSARVDAPSSPLQSSASPTAGRPVVAWLAGGEPAAWLAEVAVVDDAARIRSIAMPGRTAAPVEFTVPLSMDDSGFRDEPPAVHALAKIEDDLVLFYGDERAWDDVALKNERMVIIPLANGAQRTDRVAFETTSFVDNLGEGHWTAQHVETVLPTSGRERMLVSGSVDGGVVALTRNGRHEPALGNLFAVHYADREQVYSFTVGRNERELTVAAQHLPSGTTLRDELPWGFPADPELAAISRDGRHIVAASRNGHVLVVDVSSADAR